MENKLTWHTPGSRETDISARTPTSGADVNEHVYILPARRNDADENVHSSWNARREKDADENVHSSWNAR